MTIRYTKNGQPYTILPNGRAKFLPKKHKKVRNMARRKHYRRSRGGSMNLKKMALAGIIGVGISKYFGENKLLQAGAGYFVGGIPGAVVSAVAPQFIGNLGSKEVYY